MRKVDDGFAELAANTTVLALRVQGLSTIGEALQSLLETKMDDNSKRLEAKIDENSKALEAVIAKIDTVNGKVGFNKQFDSFSGNVAFFANYLTLLFFLVCFIQLVFSSKS